MNMLDGSDSDGLDQPRHNTTLTFIPGVEKSTLDLRKRVRPTAKR